MENLEKLRDYLRTGTAGKRRSDALKIVFQLELLSARGRRSVSSVVDRRFIFQTTDHGSAEAERFLLLMVKWDTSTWANVVSAIATPVHAIRDFMRLGTGQISDAGFLHPRSQFHSRLLSLSLLSDLSPFVPKARFEVASAETLPCADGSMDAVISRFGLMLFGDTAASARELPRLLRPGAGLSTVESELFRWNMEFANQIDLWQFLSGPGVFTRQFAELDETNKEQVRSDVIGTLAPYLQNDGRYQIPHACRLLWGQR